MCCIITKINTSIRYAFYIVEIVACLCDWLSIQTASLCWMGFFGQSIFEDKLASLEDWSNTLGVGLVTLGCLYLPCGAQVPLSPRFVCAITWVSGGAKRWVLKPYYQNRYTYAGDFGDKQSMFRPISALSIDRSHRKRGKSGSIMAKSVLDCCLNVYIACSDKCIWCVWSGTRWYVILYLSPFLLSLEALLSIITVFDCTTA